MNYQTTNQDNAEVEQNEPLNPLPSSIKVHPPPLWFSKRLLVTVLMFVCYINTAFIRCNISIAVVDMTSAKNITVGNSTETKPAEFDWDSTTVGFILSVYYYGGLASLGCGYLVTKLGGAFSCTSSLLLCGITIILHPISLNYGFFWFLICRLLLGAFESFMLVSIVEICSKWMPKNEKSKLLSITVTGLNVGLGVVHVFCAFLATQWGWAMIFYATGSICLITSLVCAILLKSQPSDDKSISKRELAYILDGTATVTLKKKVVHPYKQILLSGPVWALLWIQFAYMWLLTILITLLPLYIKDLTKDNTNVVGQISSLTNVANILMLPICGILLNYIKHFKISTTNIHKIFLGGAYIIISVLFVIDVWVSTFIMSIISLILIQMLSSMSSLVTAILRISIAPNSSSVIAGLSFFAFAISSILSRHITGFMTVNHSIAEWNHCFIVASVICFLAGAFHILYGSSEAQSWSTSSPPITHQEQNGEQSDWLDESKIKH